MSKFLNRIEEYFEFSKYKTNFRIEILAGISTYLSLAYIFIVNPAIMSGLNKFDANVNNPINVSAILFATIVASGLSTLIMGLWAKLPFALAPGLEMNGFFAVVVCGVLGLTWQEALGTVFWSGILCIILTVIPARQQIINSIPNGLKSAMAVSVGMFVLTIGLFLAGIVTFDKTTNTINSIGNFFTPKAIALYIGLILSAILGLKRLKFTAGMLIAIIVATIYCKTQNIVATTPASFSTDMFKAIGQADLLSIFTNIKLLPVFITFFLIDFYGSIGKFIGLTKATDLQSDGELVNIEKAMYVDGIGTVGGALLGTSSIITYVESAVGITMGGRTGIVAIVCGILMLLSLFITPLVGLVPVEATAGILVYVGYLLLPFKKEKVLVEDSTAINGENTTFDLLVAIVMGVLALTTFSLDKAMLVGFLAYTIKHILWDKKLNPYFIASTVLILVSVVLQYVLK